VNRQLLAVHKRQIGQFEREARSPLHPAGLNGFSHATGDGLSAARDYEPVRNQRLRQRHRERIAGLIPIA